MTPNEDGIVYVGIDKKNGPLGLIFCTNRLSGLYHLLFTDTSAKLIFNNEEIVHCPRFSPDGKKLAFLSHPVCVEHDTAMNLNLMLWETKVFGNLKR